MTEHEPQSAPIDADAIAEVLGTRSATVRDVAYGEGHQFSLGRGDARLEVFPPTGVTRLTASDVRVELFGSTVAEVSPGGVEFTRTQPGQGVSLTVVPGGGIVFTLVAGGERRPTAAVSQEGPPPPPPTTPPVRAPEPAQHDGTADTSPSLPPPVVDPPAAPQAAREDPSRPAPDRTSGPAAAETEQERISQTLILQPGSSSARFLDPFCVW